jgi:hypothetical protein
MATKELSHWRPEVIVDFTVEDGLLSVCLKNIGCRGAYHVKTDFDKPFYGLNGEKCISGMRHFKRLDFMAPGKEFCQFIDALANYARRKEPLSLKATVTYRDSEGTSYEDAMRHDLRMYLELGSARRSRNESGGDNG